MSGMGQRLIWRDQIAGNIRAERARVCLSQREVAEKMAALGFTSWRHPQTVGHVERGDRELGVEEALGLAIVLEVDLRRIFPKWDT